MLSANSAIPMNHSHNAAVLVTAVLIGVSQSHKVFHQSNWIRILFATKSSCRV